MKKQYIRYFLCFSSLLTTLVAQEGDRKEFASYDEMLGRNRDIWRKVNIDMDVAMKAATEGENPEQKLLKFAEEWRKTESGRDKPLPTGLAKVEDGDVTPKRPPNSIHDDPIYIQNSAEVVETGPGGRAFGPLARVAKVKEFPECVALGRAGAYCASGVIVENDLILTAAHICPDDPEMVPDLVWVGVVTPNSIDAPNKGRALRISRYFRHPEYRHGVSYEYPLGNDLMLLEIHPEDRFFITAKAVLLTAEEIAAFDSNPPLTIRAVGFGNDRKNYKGKPVGFGVRRYVSISMAERNVERYGLFQSESSGRPMIMEFAAGSKNAMADTCTGDSGGPVYVTTGPPEDRRFKLYGITSRPTPGAQEICGDGGVYQYFPAYHEWISSAYIPGNRESWKKVE